jgi:hypothetical protein
MKKNQRGGKRLGAGRPKSIIKTVGIKITLPLELKTFLKQLGGSKWIKEQILKHM